MWHGYCNRCFTERGRTCAFYGADDLAMSANTKIILIVIIFLLLLFAFVMPASPKSLERITSTYTAESAVGCCDFPSIRGKSLGSLEVLVYIGKGKTRVGKWEM